MYILLFCSELQFLSILFLLGSGLTLSVVASALLKLAGLASLARRHQQEPRTAPSLSVSLPPDRKKRSKQRRDLGARTPWPPSVRVRLADDVSPRAPCATIWIRIALLSLAQIVRHEAPPLLLASAHAAASELSSRRHPSPIGTRARTPSGQGEIGGRCLFLESRPDPLLLFLCEKTARGRAPVPWRH